MTEENREPAKEPQERPEATVGDQAGQAGPIRPPDPVRPAEPVGRPGPSHQAGPVGQPGPVGQTEPARPVESAGLFGPAESTGQAEPARPVEPVGQAEASGPVESGARPEVVGQAESVRPVESGGQVGAGSASASEPGRGQQGQWVAGSEWARPAAPQQNPWVTTTPAQPQEQVIFGSAAGKTPPTGNYLPNPNPPHQPAPRGDGQQRRGSGALVAGVVVLALLVGGGAGAVGGYLAGEAASSAPVVNALDQKAATNTGNTAPEPGSVESVAAAVSPAVVQLQVRGRSAAGEGSGFVISSDGLIMTNNHVVEAAAKSGEITAVFADGSQATATIVGRDPTSDLAVVKAEGKEGLPVVRLGDSDQLKVGEDVVAIGSPYELSGTVTSGIISSLHRPTRAGGEDGSQATVLDAIQTDAAINPGNSGGPLVNMRGEVIGINSAIYSPQAAQGGQGGFVGIGFAIPMNQARRTADEIVKTGKATQTVLGVTVRDGQNGGASVEEVTPGGAAEQAGIKSGDVITKLNDRRIDTSDALVAAVRSHKPGDKVRLELDNGSRTVETTLAGQPVETE